MKPALALGLAAALAACASPPKLPTARPVPSAWTEAAVQPQAVVDDAHWWRALGDTTLTELIETARQLDDVELAQTRLSEARATLVAARAALLPNLDANAGSSESRSGDASPSIDKSSIGASLDWTIDVFGAERARSAAGKARLESAEAALAATRLSTRATITALYIAARSAQAQRLAAERTAQSLEETLRLVRARRAAGLAPALEEAQAEAALAAAQARPSALAQAELSTRLSLEALLGLSPGALTARLEDHRGVMPDAPLATAPLAPMEALAQRPDLIAAERALVAAGFDAVAARRDFWPKLSLAGFYGAQGASPETALASDGVLSNVAASVAAPVLSFGRLEAARAGADARARAAAIRYRQAATAALADVERALGAAKDADFRRKAQARALSAARDQAALAQDRYRAGLSPLLEALTAERAVDEAQSALAAAEADAALAYADTRVRMGFGAA